MKQLTGLDASFLYMETASSFGHVSSLSVYRRPDDPDFKPFERLPGAAGVRLDQLEPFRRRLVEVPFALDHPYWVDDPNFDLDFHLRHMAIPPPGDDGAARRRRSPASSAGRWTAPGRCGRCTSSRASRVATSRC